MTSTVPAPVTVPVRDVAAGPVPTLSAGHLVVRELARHGTERVYCVPGESYLDVLDGLHDSAVRTVVCRQEGGAGFMALTEGRLTGRPGVALVTRGPGAANAMIAVHTAYQDATPLVLFVGLVPVADRGRESFQEFSLEGWFGTTAKAVLTLERPEEAARLTAEALRLAAAGRPGPVVVGLTEDVLKGRAPVADHGPAITTGPEVGAEAVVDVERLLAASRRPLVVVGGEDWDESSRRALARWAGARRVPVASDFRAYDIVDNGDRCFAGALGYGRSPQLAELLGEADLVLYVGAVRSDVLSDGYTLAGTTPTVVVNADSRLLGHVGRLDLHVPAGPRAFWQAVSGNDAGVPGAAAAATAREDWFARGRAVYERYAQPSSDGGEGVDRARLMAVARRLLPDDAVVTFGAGNHALWPQRFLPARAYPSVVAPKNGAMGMGVPAAVAASLALPGRTVVSFAGDGCFLMNGQELATAVATGADPTIVVLDNGTYGTIRQHQEREYPGRPSGTDLTNPDFAALAQSYGANGHRVDDLRQFEDAFRTALASGRPDVLHVRVDPHVAEPRFA